MFKNSMFFAGLDLGDKHSQIVILDQDGEVIEETRLPTTRAFFQRKFSTLQTCRIAVEVGALTAPAYILTLEDPRRFRKSREVGPALGLVPRRDQSGDHDPQLRITKTGDAYLRRLLVGSAPYVLGSFGPDRDLRSWGLKLTERGGKNAKKRAVIAVASLSWPGQGSCQCHRRPQTSSRLATEESIPGL